MCPSTAAGDLHKHTPIQTNAHIHLLSNAPVFQPSAIELFWSPLNSITMWNSLPQNVWSVGTPTVLENVEGLSLQTCLLLIPVMSVQ